MAAGPAGLPDVIVFSRAGCGYCRRAKALLSERGVHFGVVDVGVQPERRGEAVELSGGARTVPQVFVGRRCLGGFDDIKRLDDAGTLAQALVRQPEDGLPLAPTPEGTLAGGAGSVEGSSPEALAALRQRTRHFQELRYDAGSRPSMRAFLRYTLTRKVEQDQRHNVPLNLAAAPGVVAPAPALPDATATDVAALLRQMMLKLIDSFADPATGLVQYGRMKESEEWGLFRAAAAELGDPRLKPQLLGMNEADRKAFLINLYNAMTFHGLVTFGRRPGRWYLYCFFFTPSVSYRLAGVQVSLDDVENGMLRRQPGYFEGEDQSSQRGLRMSQLDARIHMALNCGSRGCPAIGVYHGTALEAELSDAAAAFCAGNVSASRGADGRVQVTASELFKMYIVDFAGTGADASKRSGQEGVIRWVLPYARTQLQELLTAALEGGKADFRFNWHPYDWSTNGPDMPLDSRIYTPTVWP